MKKPYVYYSMDRMQWEVRQDDGLYSTVLSTHATELEAKLAASGD